jgi:hypothetical protein
MVGRADARARALACANGGWRPSRGRRRVAGHGANAAAGSREGSRCVSWKRQAAGAMALLWWCVRRTKTPHPRGQRARERGGRKPACVAAGARLSDTSTGSPPEAPGRVAGKTLQQCAQAISRESHTHTIGRSLRLLCSSPARSCATLNGAVDTARSSFGLRGVLRPEVPRHWHRLPMARTQSAQAAQPRLAGSLPAWQ